MHSTPSSCKNLLPTFFMVHFLHRLYGVDAPGQLSPNEYDTMGKSRVVSSCLSRRVERVERALDTLISASIHQKETYASSLFLPYCVATASLWRYNSTGCRRRSCLRLLWPWPFDPLTWKPNRYVSRLRYIMWPNSDEISSNSYEYVVFTRFWGHCLLRLWPLTFWCQKLTNVYTRMNQNTFAVKIGWNSLYCFYHTVFTKFSGRTDSVTDWHTTTHNASGTKGFQCRSK